MIVIFFHLENADKNCGKKMFDLVFYNKKGK